MNSSKRLFLLAALAVPIGIVGGLAAYVLIHLIALLTNLLFFHRVAWKLPSFTNLDRSPSIILIAVAGGLIVGALSKWSPVIRGHGIPEAMEAVLTKQSRIAPRTAVAKPVSAAIAIGTGGPFGAEGPIIVTGGAIGSLLGQVVPVSASERKILLAAGAAAGMAATFGAPLASVVLAIELLLFEFSMRALIPLVIASSIAGGMHIAFFGSNPLFNVPPHHFSGLSELPLYLLLGIACGLLATLINKGLFVIEHGFRRLPVNPFWLPAIGAVGFACVGLAVPRVLGVGYDQISDVLAAKLAIGTLAILCIAKLIAWWVALASGTSGGTLAPILLISASFGALLGHAAQSIPGVHISPGAFALVAMAATFGAATRAAFASIVFVFELTRDYNAILPLMLATVVALLLASTLMRDSIMTEKLSRRGLRVPSDYRADTLRTLTVRDAMTTSVVTVAAETAAASVLEKFSRNGHSAYPVVDSGGHCVGVVARNDLLQDGADLDRAVGEFGSGRVVVVAPSDTLDDALGSIVEENVEHLPVVERDRLVGICTRTDILSALAQQRAHERTEAGWWRRRVNGESGQPVAQEPDR